VKTRVKNQLKSKKKIFFLSLNVVACLFHDYDFIPIEKIIIDKEKMNFRRL
jgi:hypothetical protein